MDDDLRHNYAERVAAERGRADEHGEPALVKATRVWDGVHGTHPDPEPNDTRCLCNWNGKELYTVHPECPVHGDGAL